MSQESIIVDSIDDVAPPAKKTGGKKAATTHEDVAASAASAAGLKEAGEAIDSDIDGLKSALNRHIFTWTSPFCTDVVVRFRRPPGGTREMVARVLGADHSSNPLLNREYNALASVIEINGDPVRQPTTTLTFRMLKQRIGYVDGVADGEYFDEPVATFGFAYEAAMFPDQLQMQAELEGSGLSPDDEKRILAAAGLQRPKD